MFRPRNPGRRAGANAVSPGIGDGRSPSGNEPFVSHRSSPDSEGPMRAEAIAYSRLCACSNGSTTGESGLDPDRMDGAREHWSWRDFQPRARMMGLAGHAANRAAPANDPVADHG